jgi:hypothetical protein
VHREEKFDRIFFPESVVKEAARCLHDAEDNVCSELSWLNARIKTGNVSWGFDAADEFFAEYSPSIGYANIQASVRKKTVEAYMSRYASMTVSAYGTPYGTETTITVDSDQRGTLLRPFAVFRTWAEQNPAPLPPPPSADDPQPLKIFIGHGGSQHWRDLKDSLHDHHGFDVEAFETSPRAGFTIPEVIESMAVGNALALMVLTAEDEQIDGSVRARENVVHEVGYFQGRLGSKRAILLMEEGVNEFSNIHGIVHVPYRSIREVEGQVLAIIKREFPHLAR